MKKERTNLNQDEFIDAADQKEDLKMDNNTAIKVLTSLAHGINPTTGEFLPNESVLNGLDTTRALFFAVECMRDGMQRLILWDTKSSDEPQQCLSAHQAVRKNKKQYLDGVWQYRPISGKTEDVEQGLTDKAVNTIQVEVKGEIPGSDSDIFSKDAGGKMDLYAEGNRDAQIEMKPLEKTVKQIEMQPLDPDQQMLYEENEDMGATTLQCRMDLRPI